MPRASSPPPIPKLLSFKQASVISGIAANTLRDLHVRGHLPVTRLPGCRRIYLREEDLARLIEHGREMPS